MKRKLLLLTVGTLGLFFGAKAQSGNYLLLDGSANTCMRIPNSSTANIPDGSSFTLTCWVNLANTSTNCRIMSNRQGSAGYPAFEFITSGSMQYGVNLRGSGNQNLGPSFSTATIGGAWHHLAMVVDRTAGSCSIYIDGNLDKSSTNTSIKTVSMASTQDLIIGALNSSGTFSSYAIGKLDDIRLWSTAFTQAQVKSDMTTAVHSSTANLLAGWDFENASGTSVPDISGNGNTGTLNGNAKVMADTTMTYSTTTLAAPHVPTGIGNQNQRVMTLDVSTIGAMNPVSLTSLVFNMNGTTNVNDVTNIHVYYNGQTNIFEGNPSPVLFGSASPDNSDITITGSQTLKEGDNYFVITYDVSGNATEGNLLNATIKTIKVGDSTATVSPSTIAGGRFIALTNALVVKPGDYSSLNYRIPAIVTAPDGSLVVALDKRNNGISDLGKNNNIDIIVSRSTDNGKTWSTPVTIAGLNTNYCFGDPSLVVDKNSGDVLCLFNGNTGFFQSSQSDWVHLFVCRSSDNGITWSDTTDITDQIYGPNCSNPVSSGWLGSFITSGRLTQLSSGRILGAMPVREPSGNTGVFTIYSDDGGHTWNVSTNDAVPSSGGNGNESKTVELGKDTILMSIRTPYTRRFNKSTDGGITWGTAYNGNLTDPGCDGDIMRYSSESNGIGRNRIIHSLPYNPNSTARQNVSLYVSYDEGNTWPIRRTIDSGYSGYSSVTMLPDSTIGIFYEDGEYNQEYYMYYTRVSLKWLTNGVEPAVTPAFDPSKRPTPLHALVLDGTSAYMSVPDNSGLNVSTQHGFTISGWVKVDPSVTNYPRIFSKRNGTGAGYELFVGPTGTNFGRLGVNLSTPSSGGGFGNTVVNDNNWHHIAVVIDPSSNTVFQYVDGVVTGSNTTSNISAASSNFSNTYALLFGAYNNTGSSVGYFMKGQIDDIHIWTSALSQDSVIIDSKMNVNAEKTAGTLPANVFAAWDFENITGTSVPDITGNGNTGALMGNAGLPLRIVTFTANYNATQNTATVHWQTADEINVKSLILEYSTDGISYTPVYTTTAKGGQLNSYSYIQPLSGVNSAYVYYRLGEKDLDGSVIYYDKIINVAPDNSNNGLSIYPNPATQTIHVKTGITGTLTMSVYNIGGQLMKSEKLNSDGAFIVDIATLPLGVYILKIHNETQHQSVHFIKR